MTQAAITHILMLDRKIVDVTMEAAPGETWTPITDTLLISLSFPWLQFYFYHIVLPKLLEASKLAVEKGESEGCTVSYVENLVILIIPDLLKAFDKVNLFDYCFKHRCFDRLWNHFELTKGWSTIVSQVVHKRMYATLFNSLGECAQVCSKHILS